VADLPSRLLLAVSPGRVLLDFDPIPFPFIPSSELVVRLLFLSLSAVFPWLRPWSLFCNVAVFFLCWAPSLLTPTAPVDRRGIPAGVEERLLDLEEDLLEKEEEYLRLLCLGDLDLLLDPLLLLLDPLE